MNKKGVGIEWDSCYQDICVDCDMDYDGSKWIERDIYLFIYLQTCPLWVYCFWEHNHHDGMWRGSLIEGYKSEMNDDDYDDDEIGLLKQTDMLEWCFPYQYVWENWSWDNQ